MTVDLSKIKPGDEVTVRLTVDQHSEIAEEGAGLWLFVECFLKNSPTDAKGSALVSASTIVSHTPRAIQAGDRVRPRPPTPVISPEIGTVIHVHNGSAWVAWEPLATNNGDVQPIYSLAALERA